MDQVVFDLCLCRVSKERVDVGLLACPAFVLWLSCACHLEPSASLLIPSSLHSRFDLNLYN